MSRPRLIAPGIYHWTSVHPNIGIPVSSYYLARDRVLIDPLLPAPGGLAWLKRHGPPKHILLTNCLHSRHCARIILVFGCTVWCHRTGASHVRDRIADGWGVSMESLSRERAPLDLRAYVPGDRVPGGGHVVKIGHICPHDSALVFPKYRAAAVADGVIRNGNGPLVFVPDHLLVDDLADADKVKRGLKAAYRRLARERFDHLLLAHGPPWIGDGRSALLAWAGKKDG